MSSSSRPAMFRVARQRNFALLWTAGLISLLGDWAFYTVVPVYMLDQTGSIFLAGVVWAIIALPSIVVGPVAGVYVDRWDRRRIMLWGNCAQAFASLVLVIGGAGPAIWIVMTVLLVNASLAAIILPAENALLPTLVAAEDLGPANNLNAMNDNLGRIIGPPFGALVYARFGLDVVAIVNAMSFMAAVTLVWAVKPGGCRERLAAADAVQHVTAEPFWSSLRAGVRIVWRHRLLGALFLLFGLVAFADGPIAAMIAPFIDTTLDKGAAGVGAFATVRGVAGILGSLVIGQFGWRVREDRLLVACAALNGIGFAVMGLTQDFMVACVILLVVIGPAHIGLHTTLTTLLQRGSHDSYRGRVFALLGAVTGALFLIGTLLGSAAGAQLSPPIVIFGSGLLLLVSAFAGLLLLPSARAGLPPVVASELQANDDSGATN